MDINIIKTLEEGHNQDPTLSKDENLNRFTRFADSTKMITLYQNQCVLFEMLKDIHACVSDSEGGY